MRLNALPVTRSPSVCRRVVCQIGGYAEVREAVREAAVDILAARTQARVLAFGADPDVRAAFQPYDIDDFELHTIETRRLRYDSGERGLLREALARALMRAHALDRTRQRSTDLLTPLDPEDSVWTPLRRLVDGSLAGTVSGHSDLRWHEGVGIRLDWADDRLWLLIEPRIVFDGITDNNKTAAADFGRERTVRRYNRQLNDLIAFWAELLAADSEDLHALGTGDGVDAVFQLSSDTGFSPMARA